MQQFHIVLYSSYYRNERFDFYVVMENFYKILKLSGRNSTSLSISSMYVRKMLSVITCNGVLLSEQNVGSCDL